MPLITRSAPASPLRPKSPLEFFLKHSPTPEPKEPKEVAAVVMADDDDVVDTQLPPSVPGEHTKKKKMKKNKRQSRLARSCVTQ